MRTPNGPADRAEPPGPEHAIKAHLPEHEIKSLLRANHIPVPHGITTTTPAEIPTAAASLTPPLVVKAHGPHLLHKSDQGAVRLNLHSPQEAAQAAQEILTRVPSINGFLIEEQAPPGLELIIGLTQDPHFGPLLLTGLGGIWTETLNDTSLRLCPITPYDARTLLNSLKAAPLLYGYRGRPAVDVDAVVDILLKLGGEDGLWRDLSLGEFELNPVIATPEGAIAVDARYLPARPIGSRARRHVLNQAGAGLGEVRRSIASDDHGPARRHESARESDEAMAGASQSPATTGAGRSPEGKQRVGEWENQAQHENDRAQDQIAAGQRESGKADAGLSEDANPTTIGAEQGPERDQRMSERENSATTGAGRSPEGEQRVGGWENHGKAETPDARLAQRRGRAEPEGEQRAGEWEDHGKAETPDARLAQRRGRAEPEGEQRVGEWEKHVTDFSRLFRPRKVGVVGASAKGKKGFGSMFLGFYKGVGMEVVVVHPSAEEIDGVECVRSLEG
ncbi:acetate--CoA ligase family protein, partial [Acrocarpospora corrugata]